MSRWLNVVLTCLLSCTSQAQQLVPERVVSGSQIASPHDPKATIHLPTGAHYLGGVRWPLFGIADCEVHVFVQANAHRVVQHLYWVQFEGFLPELPQLAHTYHDGVKTLWGTDFYVRADFGPTNGVPKAGSDAEHVAQLVTAAGYTMPAAILNLRLVHLLDDKQRRELMIIYMEDASLSDVGSWKDLLPGGNKAEEWPALKETLTARVQKDVLVTLH